MNKFYNRKAEYNGLKFDSVKEMERYKDLVLMQKAGEIRDLKTQVKFELLPKMRGKNRNEQGVYYKADFTYYRICKDGSDEYVVEDVKSDYTRKLPEYVIKRKLMLYRKGISIEELCDEASGRDVVRARKGRRTRTKI